MKLAESEVVSSYSWNLCGSYRRRELLFMYFQFNFYSIYWNFKTELFTRVRFFVSLVLAIKQGVLL